jgi:ribosomal protein L6P/L9E
MTFAVLPSPAPFPGKLLEWLVDVQCKPVLYVVRLRVQGVGYRLWLRGSFLLVDLGWSAFRLCRLPKAVRPLLGRGGALLLLSPSLVLVTTLAQRLLSLRRPDVYRSKGLWRVDRPLPPPKKSKKDGK